VFVNPVEPSMRTKNVSSATIEETASFGKLRKTTVSCNVPSHMSNSQVTIVASNAIMVSI